jgi:hypothetical protein
MTRRGTEGEKFSRKVTSGKVTENGLRHLFIIFPSSLNGNSFKKLLIIKWKKLNLLKNLRVLNYKLYAFPYKYIDSIDRFALVIGKCLLSFYDE